MSCPKVGGDAYGMSTSPRDLARPPLTKAKQPDDCGRPPSQLPFFSMAHFPSLPRWAALPQITTWLVICGYALVISGLPLPTGISSPGQESAATTKRLTGKDRSQPFPCMDKPCGCATAEQCFANCCCHTPAERLAWARAHNVDAAVLTALVRRTEAESPDAGSGCCAREAVKPCCSVTPRSASELPGCCGDRRSLAATPAPVDAPDEQAENETPQPKVVVLRAMLACGGIVAEWFSCGVSLPPPAAITAIVTWAPPLDTLDVIDDAIASVPTVPDLPPPRA